MGIKLRRRPRVEKVPIRPRSPHPGEPGTDPCGATWELWVRYSADLVPYIVTGADVSLYPKDGAIAVMIGTREVGRLADPAAPQIVECMDWGYVFTGTVIEVVEDDSRARLSVSGRRTDGHP